MDILTIEFEGWQKIVLSFNWFRGLLLALLVAIIVYGIRQIYKKAILKTIMISEATIGIGDSSVTIKYDGRIKEIAYKIWVELTTRKIGIKFDEEYDVISEVYDSWYEAFKIIRGLLEEVPAERLNDAKGLIDLTTKVLNKGLRPHLTKWQAKYRKWYNESVNTPQKSPQEIQREFPEYQALVKDLKKTNEIMIKYASEIRRLIDGK